VEYGGSQPVSRAKSFLKPMLVDLSSGTKSPIQMNFYFSILTAARHSGRAFVA
jgi:hypothetical protein